MQTRNENGFLSPEPGEETADFLASILVVERDLQAALKILFSEPFASDRYDDALHCLACLADEDFPYEKALDIMRQH